MNLEIKVEKYCIKGLYHEWEDILNSSASASIVQSCSWMHTWWDIYGPERKLFVVCGYKGGELIGIAPLSIGKEGTKYFKIIKFQTANLLGSGNTRARGVLSDYLDFIIKTGFEDEFIDGFLKFIKNENGWDEIILEHISEKSLLPGICRKYADKYNLNYSVTDERPCVLIKLPNSWDAFLKGLSSSTRYKINRGRKELNKIGGEYRVIKSESELSDAFQHLERLHQYRWNTKGMPGSFSSPEWRKFHKHLMKLLLPKGELKLSFIEIDNEPVAANYNFSYNDKIHFFQSGLIPHENKHIRLGLLLHSFCIEEAIQEKYKEYDFLSVGASGPGYKSMWGNHTRMLKTIRISKKSNKEAVYSLFKLSKVQIKKIIK